MTLQIDSSYFVGQISIPTLSAQGIGVSNVVAAARESELNQWMTSLESKFLHECLGNLYQPFVDGMTAVPVDPKWQNIYNLLVNTLLHTSPYAHYVWWHWTRDMSEISTGMGEATSNMENAKAVSPIRKMIRVWNEMVDHLLAMKSFIEINHDIYGDLDLSAFSYSERGGFERAQYPDVYSYQSLF